MKIRNFGLVLLIILLQATAGPYGSSLLCHARNSKEGKKIIQSFCFSLEFLYANGWFM